MEYEQFNVTIPVEEARKIKVDAINVDATLLNYVVQACRHFRTSLKIEERRAIFPKKSRKILGRPLTTAKAA